jgi:hypothetical protein
MNNKHSFVNHIAIITFLFEDFPRVLPITTRHLSIKRLIIPMFEATRLTAISPATSPEHLVWNDAKDFIASQTNALNLIRPGLRAANARTKFLGTLGVFFGNELLVTLKASIRDNRLCSKNCSTFMSASYVARFMTFVYNKLIGTNRASFRYFSHGDILS